jgi:predicted CXXCH cytochrome family protein
VGLSGTVGSGRPAAPPVSQPAAEADALERLARGIIGSKHDFTDSGRVARDLCLPCHTPHVTSREAPLITATQPAPVSGLALGAEVQLSAASLLCLSCHDGVVASDVYAGPHAMTWSDRAGGGVRAGTSRLTSHPIGTLYPVARPDYASPGAVSSDGRIKLPDGRIQCTSCHDPHNTERHHGMLVISNERSRLCLTCHRL